MVEHEGTSKRNLDNYDQTMDSRLRGNDEVFSANEKAFRQRHLSPLTPSSS
jgi:hypothetical protein